MGASMKVLTAYKFVVCCCLFCSAIYCKDFSEENKEILQQFEIFLKEKEKQHETDLTAEKKIVDRNFLLIDNFQEQTRKLLENRREVLLQNPEDFRLALDCIANSIREKKNLCQEKQLIESAIRPILEIKDLYERIITHINDIIIMIKCIDIIIDDNIGIIAFLKRCNHKNPVEKNVVNSILNTIEPMRKFLPENSQNMITSIFLEASKSKYEDRQNIPSYYCFHVLSNILNCMEKIYKNINATAFYRSFENANYSAQKLLTDLNNIATSDETARNILPLIDDAKKNLMSQMDFLKKRSREWKEYIQNIENIYKQVKSAIKKIIEEDKDQSIFDDVESN